MSPGRSVLLLRKHCAGFSCRSWSRYRKRLYSLSPIDLVSWIHLFSSHLQAFTWEVSGQPEFVQHVGAVPFFSDLYLPVSDTVFLHQVCAGFTDGFNNGGRKPARWALDLLWLGSCDNVYLPASGTSSNNASESATVPFKFLKNSCIN